MKRVLALIFVLALALGLFVGCSGDDNDTSSNSSNGTSENVDGIISTADVNFVTADGDSVYRIIRPDGDKEAMTVSQYLFKQMKNKLGTNVRNSADTEDGTDAYEILIGNTNRPESKQAKEYLMGKTGARYEEYVICTIGKKICIFSDNPEQLKAATEYFVENFVKKEGVKGGIVYLKAIEGEFENISINGTNIGLFSFVRPRYNSSWLTQVEMEKISDTIYKKCGYKIQIKHDTVTQPQEYEIIVGDTNREGVEKITNYDEFKITVKGKKVYINGGSAHATAMGVSEFAKLLKGDVKDSVSCTGSYQTALKSYDKTTTFYKTWGDDFDGTALDTTKWWQCNETQHPAEGQNGKLSVRSTNPDDVFVANGKITMCARYDDNYYYGGMIRTEGLMSYKYGYAEISTLIPHGDSFWVAWWTWSENTESSIVPNTPSLNLPEIDILECFGDSKLYHPNCHAWPTETGKEQGYVHSSLDGRGLGNRYECPDEGVVLGDGFHTYGFLWDNTKMSFMCDGNLYFTYDTTTSEQDKEAYNHSMFFICSLATAFANQRPVTQDPDEWQNTNKFIIDWVNLYQKDDGLCELDWVNGK